MSFTPDILEIISLYVFDADFNRLAGLNTSAIYRDPIIDYTNRSNARSLFYSSVITFHSYDAAIVYRCHMVIMRRYRAMFVLTMGPWNNEEDHEEGVNVEWYLWWY